MIFKQEEIDIVEQYLLEKYHKSAEIQVDGDIIRFNIPCFGTEGWIIKHEESYSAKYRDYDSKNHNGEYIRVSSGEIFDISLKNILYKVKSAYFERREERLLQSFRKHNIQNEEDDDLCVKTYTDVAEMIKETDCIPNKENEEVQCRRR